MSVNRRQYAGPNSHARIENRGFVLPAVLFAITLLAAVAFVLAYQGASQTGIASGELERDQLRYVAEAGLAHASSQLAQNTSCAGYTNLPSTTFGGDSYSASITPTSASPITVTATGTLQSGAQTTLVKRGVRTYQAPNAITLQLSTTGGQDALLDDFYPLRNYGGADYLQITDSGSWRQRPVLRFDLSGVPVAATILSARLELKHLSTDTEGIASIHRLTRDWIEGTKAGGGTADGANWPSHDGTNSWNTAGGDFDTTTVATMPVTSATHNLWLGWEIGTLVADWVAGSLPNHGLLIKSDGPMYKAKFASRETSNPADAPKLTITYACECGKVCGPAPGAGKNVLLVVVDPSNLTGQEADKQALIESWGHTVNLIDESASQGEFDAAIADNDVAYVAEDITSGSLGTKLREATIGVVIEEQAITDEFGISSGNTTFTESSIDITDNGHYITSPFSLGSIAFADSPQDVGAATGTLAPGLDILAQRPSSTMGMLDVIETGGALHDSGTAAGRRVKLPWGGNNFDINSLTTDGRTIMQRAIEWGAAESPVVANDGWAVGDSGSIYYTADAGASWTPQTSGTAQALYAVNFPTPLIGYAAGTGEVLLKTTDGGNAWNTLSTGTQSLWALDFLDADSGYTVGLGATIKMTTDGGSNWANQDPATTQNLRHIDFVDASTGYLAGLGGVIRKTTNGGTNWSVQNSGVTTALYSLDFADASTGWAVGDLGVIVKTSDGSATWNPQVSGTSNKLQSVAAIDSSTAIAVGRVGLILKTTDGGSSWATQASGTTGDLWYVHFVDATTGYVAGQNGEMLKTTDGGATWTSTDLGTSVTMRAVFFAKNGAGGPATGPIAHWKLDDGTGTTAIDSEGGHDGTLTNGPVWVVGQLGDALDFDGADDYVDLTSDAELDDVFAGGATVMAWIEPAGWGGSGYGRIFDKSSSPSSTGDGWAIRLNTDNGGLNFGQGFTSGRGWWRFAESSINLGTWQHIAIAYDASSTANDPVVYLDGSPVAVTRVDTPSGTLRSDAAINLRLGAHATGTAQSFEGKIDDARIYDRILGAAEIADIAAGGGGGGGPTPPYLDEFNARNCNSADYAGSDGTMDWTASSWTEVGESNGSCAGLVQVAEDPDIPETGSYRLMLDERLRDVTRTVDLSGFSSATLSFDFRRYNYPTTSDYFAVLVSRDGSIWSALEQFSGIATDANYQTASYDISPFIQATTQIAFATKGINTLQTVYIDNVRITEDGGGAGPVCLGTMRDEFNAQVWSGSDGSLSWASNWSEIYEGGTPTGGDIMVIDDLGPYSARVRDNGTTNNGAGIQRQANLSAFASATLNFDYRRDGPDNASDYVTVDVSSDGGGSWTELDRFIGEGTNTTDPSYVSTSYDITAFMSSNTRIRFLSSPLFGNTDIVYFDNVEICLGN